MFLKILYFDYTIIERENNKDLTKPTFPTIIHSGHEKFIKTNVGYIK